MTTTTPSNAAKPMAPPADGPPAFNRDAYAHRNTVERSFLRLKHWRGIAQPPRQTRPDLPRRCRPGRDPGPLEDQSTLTLKKPATLEPLNITVRGRLSADLSS